MAWESPHAIGRDYVVISVHAQMRIGKSDLGEAFCVFINNSHVGKTMGCETYWPSSTYMWLAFDVATKRMETEIFMAML